MIKSMTGFGRACSEVDGIAYCVEIKTVNNRYLKTNVKVADVASFLSDKIEKLLREKIQRGTINYSLYVKNVPDQLLFDIDEKVLQAYTTKLTNLEVANDLKCRINLADLLTLPGAVLPATPDAEQAEKMERAILQVTEQALENLTQMRISEGKVLADELTENCGTIKEKLNLIRTKSPVVIKNYHDKLQKRADELLKDAKLNIDNDMLTREVAVFADRSDIAEELARLNSHLTQFAEFCRSNENGGRRLDFISQEMLREANTIASKACDTEICRWVIDIKCAIDRIKEQVQNIE